MSYSRDLLHGRVVHGGVKVHGVGLVDEELEGFGALGLGGLDAQAVHLHRGCEVQVQQNLGNIQLIITSIAHRIKNPLRRTSEHITLHDLKH